MAILKFFKDSSILENNMVQTQASSAGTLSSVIFVLPGLLMMGYWQEFPFWQTVLICACWRYVGRTIHYSITSCDGRKQRLTLS